MLLSKSGKASVAKAIDFLESPEGKTALKEEKKAVKVRNSCYGRAVAVLVILPAIRVPLTVPSTLPCSGG